MNNTGVIYILTNPSFPQYVKIGYANDLKSRLKNLNRSECIPFAFRVYAYYKVPKRLTDLEIHKIIDTINPNLRAIETIDGKERKREFYDKPGIRRREAKKAGIKNSRKRERMNNRAN